MTRPRSYSNRCWYSRRIGGHKAFKNKQEQTRSNKNEAGTSQGHTRRRVRKRFGRDAPNSLTRMAPAPGFGRLGPRGVRDRLGRAGRFGRPGEIPSRFFDLLAPNRALRWIENPRVDGSIPSLATTSTFLIFNGF